MDDRRGIRRTRVLRNAKIIANGHPWNSRSSMIHCTLRDLSSRGAQLSLASTYRIPDTFELTFEHGRTRRMCWVVWRTSDRFGVRFDKPPDEPTSPEDTSHSCADAR
jgi:hypothetical protein